MFANFSSVFDHNIYLSVGAPFGQKLNVFAGEGRLDTVDEVCGRDPSIVESVAGARSFCGGGSVDK